MPNREGGITHPGWSIPRESESVVAQSEANILAALEEHGNRMTWPRRQLAATLARRSSSFSVEEVVSEIPSLGRATVYRTIRLLVEIGILCKAVMPNGSPRYSLDAFHHHHHVVCVSCGRVDQLRLPAVERVIRTIKNDLSGDFIGHRLELYHCCSACLESGQSVDARVHGSHFR